MAAPGRPARARAAGAPPLAGPPAQHVRVSLAACHSRAVEVLEQRLRVAARGSELVPDGRDRRLPVALADPHHPRLELRQRVRVEVQVARDAHRLPRTLELPEPALDLGRRNPDRLGEVAVRSRLNTIGPQERRDLERGFGQRLGLCLCLCLYLYLYLYFYFYFYF